MSPRSLTSAPAARTVEQRPLGQLAQRERRVRRGAFAARRGARPPRHGGENMAVWLRATRMPPPCDRYTFALRSRSSNRSTNSPTVSDVPRKSMPPGFNA